jgi:hypothetical protein
MSEDKKAVAESKLSLSEEMHLGFLQLIAKTNTEKITRETLEGLSEDTGDSDSYDVQSGGEDSEDRPWRPSHTVFGKSSIKQSHLDTMRGRYFRDMSIVRVDDGEKTVPTPEENEVVIFRSFLKAGLWFPLSKFVVEVLKIFEVYLHQLTPESIIRMGIFFWAVRSQGLEPNAKSFCNIHELLYETKPWGKEQYHNNFGCYSFGARSGSSCPVPTFQNERVPPPPPPPPTLQELMAQQNEILQQLAQRQPPPQHYGGGDHQRHPAAATYQEFLSTQPPLFTRVEDPLDADVWLRVVESKFLLLHGVCSELTKVRFATQQLRGPARTWWDHFLAMQPVDREVEWRGFKAAFTGHHIPAGIMDRKLNEFLALTQGNRTVIQYAQAFNDLCQYAGYHADTDEKKRNRFRRGLSTKHRDHLNTVRANSYNELVNMAISQEDCITARQAEKKRKTPVAGTSAQPQRFRIVSDTQNRGPQQQ